jgi:3-oxoadipate enol-lactonase
MTRWTQANGVSLRYTDNGGSGPVVVFAHEMGGCLESWDAVIALMGDRIRAVAYDARGAGLSEKPAGATGIDDLASDMGALLDALDIAGPAVLAGCAVGAATAIRLAVTRPERVAGLLLLAPATGMAPDKRADTLVLADRVEAEGVRERVLERFNISYPARYFATPADRLQALGRLMQADPRSYAEAYRMLCRMDLEPDLPLITAPARVLAGVHDRTRPPERVQAVAQAIPDARFAAIDSGHAMHVLTPALVAGHLGDFLDDLRLPQGG